MKSIGRFFDMLTLMFAFCFGFILFTIINNVIGVAGTIITGIVLAFLVVWVFSRNEGD